MGSAILIATAAWHVLAFWHFAVYPERTLARTTRERPVNPLAAEVFRFLGGMNLGIVALASLTLALPGPVRWVAFVALAVANLSQLVVDLRVKRRGLVHGPMFAQILWGDAIFTVANGVAAGLGASWG